MDTCLYDYFTAEGIKKDLVFTCQPHAHSFLNFTLPLNDSSKTFYLMRHDGQIDSMHFNYHLILEAQSNCGFTSKIGSLEIDPLKSSIKGDSWYAQTNDSIPMRYYWGLGYY